MKLGLGFAVPNLTDDNLRLAAQLGVTHIIVGGPDLGPGYFELDPLLRLRSRVESFGLVLAGIENFPHAWWGMSRTSFLSHSSFG